MTYSFNLPLRDQLLNMLSYWSIMKPLLYMYITYVNQKNVSAIIRFHDTMVWLTRVITYSYLSLSRQILEYKYNVTVTLTSSCNSARQWKYFNQRFSLENI